MFPLPSHLRFISIFLILHIFHSFFVQQTTKKTTPLKEGERGGGGRKKFVHSESIKWRTNWSWSWCEIRLLVKRGEIFCFELIELKLFLVGFVLYFDKKMKIQLKITNFKIPGSLEFVFCSFIWTHQRVVWFLISRKDLFQSFCFAEFQNFIASRLLKLHHFE